MRSPPELENQSRISMLIEKKCIFRSASMLVHILDSGIYSHQGA
jgi:hypothetical protein